MWSPDACIEMLLIFSLKEVDGRFKSGAVLPRENVMTKRMPTFCQGRR